MKKVDRINLGLAISACHCIPGMRRTHSEIAAFCGCSRQRIEQIEKKALRKIRAALYRNPELQEELREHGIIR